MKIDRRLIGAAAALSLGLLPMLDVAPAQAIGCFTGGAAGAVAGHYAGHHAVWGAVGGCIAGHHMKVVQQRKAAAEAAAAAAAKKAPPAPAPTAAPAPPRRRRPPNKAGVQSRYAFPFSDRAADTSSGQRGRADAARSSTKPRRRRSIPAHAIIAPLSVQSAGGGATSGTPACAQKRAIASRISPFAATPPEITIAWAAPAR